MPRHACWVPTGDARAAPRSAAKRRHEALPRGAEISGAFFHQYGLLTIAQAFPGLEAHVSAGLFGRGSEVIGADDELSRDHGWGPKFTVFLDPHAVPLGCHGQRSTHCLPWLC